MGQGDVLSWGTGILHNSTGEYLQCVYKHVSWLRTVLYDSYCESEDPQTLKMAQWKGISDVL